MVVSENIVFVIGMTFELSDAFFIVEDSGLVGGEEEYATLPVIVTLQYEPIILVVNGEVFSSNYESNKLPARSCSRRGCLYDLDAIVRRAALSEGCTQLRVWVRGFRALLYAMWVPGTHCVSQPRLKQIRVLLAKSKIT